ncbi:TRAP transporter substrate-binding protein [Marinobacterium maritimum]|uniref:TRAP transporter substrate-binding protein n=1 Tax=Marinobacterium maritimum TaxID=500162 RepID=A0ABN1I9N0_9GAMM
MSIHRLCKHLMVGLISTLTLLSGAAQAETILRVASWAPPSHPQNSVVIPTWAEWVQEATDGRVKVVVDYDLGHPKTMFDIVEDGVADASWSYHGYVPGRFILPMAVELPGLGADAEAASVALWRTYNKEFASAGEFAGLTLLGMFTHGPGQLHTRTPVTSWDQLEGKKIRVGGGVQSELASRMGITPVSAPASKVYEMMQQGVIDGVFLTLSDQKGFRLFEVAPHVTVVPNGMYLGSFSMFINPDFLESLEPRDAEAIMKVSGEKLSAMAGRAWETADEEGLATAKQEGVKVNVLSETDPMTTSFHDLIQGMDEAWIQKASERGIDARAALEELRKTAREYTSSTQE